MLYLFSKRDELLPLPAIQGLEIKKVYDPLLMSVIGQISLDEATSRLANDHLAFVAYLNDVPAAFGWVAGGKARVGELDYEFILPVGHRYLWNFRTLHDFRGLGIYPLLLQYILATEKPKAANFWIMHAPENKASERGITKAGFKLVGPVSVINGHEVIFDNQHHSLELKDVLTTFGFTASEEEQATCWNCSSPFLRNRKEECCCVPNNKKCTRNLYQPVAVAEEYP